MYTLGISISDKNCHLAADYCAAGFSVAEMVLPLNDPDWFAIGDKMQADIKAAGLKLWSVHLPYGSHVDISNPDAEGRAKAIEILRPQIEAAKGWGAQVLVIHGSFEPYKDEERGVRIVAAARGLRELNKAAAPLKLALEVLPRTCIARDSGETALLAKECGGICFDVNHLLNQSHDEFLDEAGAQVITTHLSDYDGINERHWLPGEFENCIVPWKTVAERLTKEYGYTGPFLFELRCPDDIPYAPEAIVAAWEAALNK